jgi:hypothetical protein
MGSPVEIDAPGKLALMMAYLCVREEKGLPRQVAILDRFGLSNSQIASVCGAAVQSIKNARSAKGYVGLAVEGQKKKSISKE